jgi:hypothetical protein
MFNRFNKSRIYLSGIVFVIILIFISLFGILNSLSLLTDYEDGLRMAQIDLKIDGYNEQIIHTINFYVNNIAEIKKFIAINKYLLLVIYPILLGVLGYSLYKSKESVLPKK